MKSNKIKIFALLIGLGMLSCVEDGVSPEITPSTINFEHPTIELVLGQAPVKININLDQPSPRAGTVKVKLTGDAAYGEEFETLPAPMDQFLNLSIEMGQEQLELILIPKGEGKFDGEKTVSMKLETVSEGFDIGDRPQTTITLRDEIQTASVSFKGSSVEILESDELGSDILISIDGLVRSGSFIKVKFTSDSAAYGSRFLTDPVLVEEEIILFPQPGTEEITFNVHPINDDQLKGDYSIQMAITETGNHMVIGNENELVLTIKEDEQAEIPETHSIADLRNEFLREDVWYLPTDYFIQGVITSHENLIDDAVYIQDETAGILIKFTGENLLKRGDHVRLNLKSAEGKNINGQEAIVSVSDRIGINLGENVSLEPEIITLKQLQTDNYRGKLVRIEGVTFPEANGSVTFENARKISDGKYQGIVHTYPSALFYQQKLPQGTVNVTGIVGDWNRILPQIYQEDIYIVQ